ncbi:retinol dehydrogenase 11 isoform X2 [Drosophila eugracilis]|uniref:retinol dehydrogenase 11 isoform X2 n=1 Tax=Drosophila eugracilis TaxID=29029 RepID=UPI0007E8AFD9|nr:retinol dehydrogenase 11 isoform X2 [Drosophila eugracilis]
MCTDVCTPKPATHRTPHYQFYQLSNSNRCGDHLKTRRISPAVALWNRPLKRPDRFASMEIIISFLHKIAPIFLAHGVVGIIAFCVRLYMQGGKFRKQTDETGKVAIVTGGNTGLGKETVMELARRGATVYMACRDKEKGERARKEIVKETGNSNVFSRECDLSSLDSIRKFAQDFKKEQRELHILINNAGVFWEPRRLTKEGFEMHLGVNHIGHFLLTNLLLDVLERSAPSRVVVVASRAHERGQIQVEDINSSDFYDEGAAYCQSKLANILFSRELAKRLEGTGVTVNALNPGIADTEIARNMVFFKTKFAQYVVETILRPLLWSVMKTPKNGAQTTLYAALDPDLENISGQYFSDCHLAPVAPAALDDQMAKWLWAVSEKWTEISL